MGLLLGMVGGLAYGLSAFAGVFAMLPLLVLGAGLGVHAAIPVCLFALGICGAVAAADAVRARQCDVLLAAWLLAGGLPVALALGWAAQALAAALLASVFGIAAIASALALWIVARRRGDLRPPAPAALLAAPRRPLLDSARGRRYRVSTRAAAATAGAACGGLAALCGAPDAAPGAAALRRALPGQPFEVAGTLAFAAALLAVLSAGGQFLIAPAAPGYTAGLFVLGAVAGMGLARRLPAALAAWSGRSGVPVLVAVLAMAFWAASMAGLAGHD